MLQKSILCGFKGAVNLCIGAVVAANGALIRATVQDGGAGTAKRYKGLYGMYNNIVPTLETLLCMGVLCVLLERVVLKGVVANPWQRMAVAMAICMVLMMLICTLLRVFEKRKDCCADYDYRSSHARVGGYGTHFAVPESEQNRNMLCTLIPGKKASAFFAFDRHVSGASHSDCRVHRGLGERVLHSVGAAVAFPLWVVMLALNCVEFPLVLFLDCVALCTRKGRAVPFAGSRDVVCQMLYGVYQLAEPVTCLLPRRAQLAVGQAFAGATCSVLGSSGERGADCDPEPKLEEAKLGGTGQESIKAVYV
ncbi:hypothetical protein [Neorickettsia findlayensis]|nr:hypothetical protein [Neorickettsia findlayensis]